MPNNKRQHAHNHKNILKITARKYTSKNETGTQQIFISLAVSLTMTYNPHAYIKIQDCSKKKMCTSDNNTKNYLCFYNLLLPAHFVFLSSGRQASTILPPSILLSSWPSLPLRRLPWYCHCVHEVLVNHDIQISKTVLTTSHRNGTLGYPLQYSS